MSTELFTPSSARRIVQREAARWWWAPLAGAVMWFVVAWLVLRADYTSLATVGLIVGLAFFMVAVNETALASLMRGGWAVWHYALALIFVLGGLWAFVRPVNTFFALVSVLGLLLLLQGVFTMTRGIVLRYETAYWWLDMVCGGLLTLLGLWVSTSNGVWNVGTRAAFVLLWVGFLAIVRGVSDIALALSLREFGSGATPERWALPSAGTAPDGAAQQRPKEPVAHGPRV